MSLSPKNILTLSFALVTLVNCGGSADFKPKTASDGNISALEPALLSAPQRAIATRICYAYQSKGTAFRTTAFLGRSFKFDLTQRDCSNQTGSYSLLPVLRYNENNVLEFTPQQQTNETPRPIIGIVQTDVNGFLSQLCTKIKNNAPINNTNVTNDMRVQVEFARSDMDSYTLRFFTPVGDKFRLDGVDTFKVRTQFNLTAGQILGMDEQITRQKACPGLVANGQQVFSQLEQKFDSLLPSN